MACLPCTGSGPDLPPIPTPKVGAAFYRRSSGGQSRSYSRHRYPCTLARVFDGSSAHASTCPAFIARTRPVWVVANRALIVDALTQRRLEVCRAPVLLQQVTEGLVRKLLEVLHPFPSLPVPLGL